MSQRLESATPFVYAVSDALGQPRNVMVYSRKRALGKTRRCDLSVSVEKYTQHSVAAYSDAGCRAAVGSKEPAAQENGNPPKETTKGPRPEPDHLPEEPAKSTCRKLRSKERQGRKYWFNLSTPSRPLRPETVKGLHIEALRSFGKTRMLAVGTALRTGGTSAGCDAEGNNQCDPWALKKIGTAKRAMWTSSESKCRDAVCVGVLRNSTFIP